LFPGFQSWPLRRIWGGLSPLNAQGQPHLIKGWLSRLVYRHFNLTPYELYVRVDRN
jgi:hypothetical protein